MGNSPAAYYYVLQLRLTSSTRLSASLLNKQIDTNRFRNYNLTSFITPSIHTVISKRISMIPRQFSVYCVDAYAMLHSKRLGSTFVPDTWRVLPQRRITRHLTQKHEPEGPVIRKHLVQPSTDKHVKKYEKDFRAHWEGPAQKSKLPRLKLANRSQDAPPYYHEPARQDISPTQEWLTSMGSAVNVIPKNLPQVEFPAGDVVASSPSSGPMPKRTQEDRQRVEAVLELRISHLAKYISPEMMESIKESPYYARYKNAVLLRCHQHQSQGANQRQCYRNLNSLIRNVANEILYRERKIVVDEMAYGREADIDDSQ